MLAIFPRPVRALTTRRAKSFQPALAPVLAAPARHDGLRAGHLRPARLRHPRVAGHRAGRRRARHGPRRSSSASRRRYLGGRTDGFLSLVTDMLPGAADVPADHRDRRLRRKSAACRHARRRARRDRLVVRRPAAARAGAVAAEPRLPRVGPRPRRAAVVHHRVRDPADDDLADRRELPRRGALRGAHRGRPAVHRPRRPQLAELGHDALLGAEQRGALRPACRCGRSRPASASRCSVRRSPCSTTPSTRSATRRCGAEARTGAVPQGRAAAAGARGCRRPAVSRSRTSASSTRPTRGPVVAVDHVDLDVAPRRVRRRSSASRAAASRRCCSRSPSCSARRYRARSSAAAFSSRAATWSRIERARAAPRRAGATSRSSCRAR